MPTNAPLNRKLRMGLIGGGQGAFIGRVHATAAILDNRAVLVAGALSADPAKAKASAPDYDIKPERAYGSYQEMLAGAAKLPAQPAASATSAPTLTTWAASSPACCPNRSHVCSRRSRAAGSSTTTAWPPSATPAGRWAR